MKYILTTILSAVLICGVCRAENIPGTADTKVKMSYSIGYQVGSDFRRQGIEIGPEVLLKGIRDAMSGTVPLMTYPEMRNALADLQKKVSEKQEK